MEIPLLAKTKRDGTMEYRIHPLFRVFSLTSSLTIAAASILFGNVSVFGLALSLAALLGALYTEHWRFSPGAIQYATGIMPFARRREWTRAEASCVILSVFMKGAVDQSKAYESLRKSEERVSKPKTWIFAPEAKFRFRLAIEWSDGTSTLVDEAGIRSKEKLSSLGVVISRITGIPFKKQPD